MIKPPHDMAIEEWRRQIMKKPDDSIDRRQWPRFQIFKLRVKLVEKLLGFAMLVRTVLMEDEAREYDTWRLGEIGG